jgi:hypothetical protein
MASIKTKRLQHLAEEVMELRGAAGTPLSASPASFAVCMVANRRGLIACGEGRLY